MGNKPKMIFIIIHLVLAVFLLNDGRASGENRNRWQKCSDSELCHCRINKSKMSAYFNRDRFDETIHFEPLPSAIDKLQMEQSAFRNPSSTTFPTHLKIIRVHLKNNEIRYMSPNEFLDENTSKISELTLKLTEMKELKFTRIISYSPIEHLVVSKNDFQRNVDFTVWSFFANLAVGSKSFDQLNLHPLQFSSIPRLSYLSLSSNKLRSNIQEEWDTCLENMTVWDLSFDTIKYLNGSNTSGLRPSKVMYVSRLFSENGRFDSGFGRSNSYNFTSPPEMVKRLLDDNHPNKCTTKSQLLPGYVASVCSFIGLILILVVTVTNRWYLLFYWYRFKKLIKLKNKPNGSESESFVGNSSILYDAYVINSDADGHFVDHQFVPLVQEKLGYKIHTSNKDGVVGGSKADNYFDAIHASQCVIVIFSNSLMKDAWCQFQVDIALISMVESNGRKKIFVVILNDTNMESANKSWCVLLTKKASAKWSDRENSIRQRLLIEELTSVLGSPKTI